MKKLLILFLTLVMLLSCCPLAAMAETAPVEAAPAKEVNQPQTAAPLADTRLAAASSNSGSCGANLTWKITSTGVVTISGTGAMDDFSGDGGPWFGSSYTVKSVVISSGVTSIGKFAFYYADEMTSVTIPSTVESIGDYAFSYCSALSNITISNGVKSIGSYAFYQCSSLTSIALPASIAKLGSNAFTSCSQLQSAYFNGAPPEMGSDVFQFVPKTLVIYPSDARSWVCSRQYDTTKGTWNGYTLSVTITPLVNGKLGDNITWALDSAGVLTISGAGEMKAPSGGSWPWAGFNIGKLVVNENITSIGANAFANMTSLVIVELPESLLNIGSGAFANCSALEDIRVKSWLCEAPDSAFTGCTNIEDYAAYSGTVIYDVIYRATNGTRRGTSPTKSTKSFSCGNAVVSTYENGLCIIERFMNTATGQLNGTMQTIYSSKLYISDGITLIGDNAFAGNTTLRSIRFPKNDMTIGNKAFYQCKLEHLDFGTTGAERTYTLMDNCFSFCYNLQSVDFGDANIKMYYLQQHGSGSSAYTTTEYASWCFFDDEALTEIDFGSGKVEPGRSTFESCIALQSVHVTDNVVMNGNYNSGYDLFHDCSKLQTAIFDCAYIGPFLLENDTALTSVTFTNPDVQFYWLEQNSGHLFNTDSSKWGTIKIIGYECSKAKIFATRGSHGASGANWPVLTFESIAGDPKTHTVVTDAAVAATCTTTGLTEGSHCTHCGAVLVPQQIVPVREHSYQKAWTCNETNHWHRCSDCDAKDAVLPHNFGDWVTTVEPTHTTGGSRYRVCQDCQYKQVETLDPLEHSFSTTWSYDEDNHWRTCSCGATDGLAAHQMGDWEVLTPADYFVAGLQKRSCTTCQYTEQEIIPAIIPPVNAGDVDGNHLIQPKDLFLLSRHVAGIQALESETLADINDDGKITAKDLVIFARLLLSLEKTQP